MFGLDSILGGIGDVAGYFAGQGDRQEGERDLERARKGYEDIDPNIAAQEAGRSNFDNAGTASSAAQNDILSQLRNKYNAGGLDALDRARLSEINQSTAQAGRGASEAAKDDAARRGMLNSASTLVAQQQAGQNAAQVGSNQGIQAAGMAEQARRAGMNQAGWMAGQMRSQDYEKAAAQDAIARFNASQRQGAEQATLHGKLARQGGIADIYGQQYGAKNASADRTQRLYGGIGRMAGGVANYFANPAAGAGLNVDQAWQGVNDAGGLPGPGTGMAEGGVVPGEAAVPGDSPANDQVPIVASPGEVVIPRSVVELLKRLLQPGTKPIAPPSSSPSVFDARTAIQGHNQRLEQALEGAR